MSKANYSALLAALLVLLVVTDHQIIAAITPQLAATFGTSKILVSYSIVIYAITAAVLALALCSRKARKFMQPQLLPFAALCYAVACAGAALSSSIGSFLATRIVAGFAGGLISALAITSIATVSCYEERGSSMSLISASYYLAPLLGVPVGIFVTQYFGARGVFALTGCLVGIAGFLLYRLPLFAAQDSHDKALVQHEGVRGEAGPPDNSAQRDRKSQALGVTSAFFISGGVIGFTAYIGTWLFDYWQSTLIKVGIIYVLINGIALAGGILGGPLADRFGKQAMLSRGNLVLAGFLFLLPVASGQVVAVSLIAIVSFFAAMRVAPLQALLTELVAPADCASYLALRNVASQAGIAVAVLLAGQLYLRFGLAGVGVLSGVFTVGAWFTMRGIAEPGITQLPRDSAINSALYCNAYESGQ